MTKWSALMACIVSLFVIQTIRMQITSAHRAPEHWYEVRVLKQYDSDDWAMIGKPGSPNAGDIEFRYHGCPDFPNATVIWPGYWAREAIWDEHGDCKSILAEGRGFYWYADEHNNVRRID